MTQNENEIDARYMMSKSRKTNDGSSGNDDGNGGNDDGNGGNGREGIRNYE